MERKRRRRGTNSFGSRLALSHQAMTCLELKRARLEFTHETTPIISAQKKGYITTNENEGV
jgi:hypothetical protein